MTTSDGVPDGDLAQAIARLANDMFANRPHASNVGAGGASQSVVVPPVPGPISRPPTPHAPIPKEADLRPIGTLASYYTNVPLAQPMPENSGSAPYFLDIAGMPAGIAPPSGHAPTPQGAPISHNASSPTAAMPSGTSPTAAMPSATPSAIPSNGFPSELHVPIVHDTRGAHDPYAQHGGVASPHTSPDVPSSNAIPHGAPTPSANPEAPAAPRAHANHVYPTSFSPELVDAHDANRAGKASSRGASTPGLFDAASVKKDFPILNEVVNGRRIVWLDNAATTQKPNAVIERLSHYYRHENSNVHRAAHTLAARATEAYEGARDTVRRFINAPESKNIVFVRGATEAINLVAKTWGARHVEEGDEILITWLEHHANIVPWQMLAREKKAKLKVAPVDDRGEIILEEFEKLLSPRTRIVSFTQVSNALGSVTPAKEMIAMARRYDAKILLDGAQAVSHMPVDVQALDPDFYVFSGHKIFAPTGIGALYGKSELLERMPPWQGGGNMIQDVTFEKTVYQGPPWKFEAGTGNIGDAAGLGAALDYLSSLGLANVERYEHELREYAEGCLRGVPGLRVIGNAKEKAGVISFVLDGVRTEDVSGLLDQEGIAVRSGHHCAQPILRRFGLESTIRASLAPYNTKEDIDALVAALHRLQVGRPRRSL